MLLYSLNFSVLYSILRAQPFYLVRIMATLFYAIGLGIMLGIFDYLEEQ